MKDKLKEINGKYYQECEVVMLATDKAKAGQIYLKPIVGILNEIAANNHNNGVYNVMPQHLYFLSNEEIKGGDWYFDPYENKILQCLSHMVYINTMMRKVIATTDKDIQALKFAGSKLEAFSKMLTGVKAQPSKSFIQVYIKAYNEGKPITKVLVEYKKCYNQPVDENYEKFDDLWVSVGLKLNSSNEITIKKVKDSWTREEVIKLCKSAFITGTRENDVDYFEWEIKNL